jgi:hypothetical protein
LTLNKLFIGLGCLIIAALFTALIGPHFVDWTGYRDFFERQASAYVGRPVSIAGKANVRILPTPVLSFTDMRVGEVEAPDVEVERFRAEIDLTSLLKGEIRVLEMTLERPRFRFDIARLAGGRPGGRLGNIEAEQVSLARLEVADGTALIEDSRNARNWRAEAINGVLEASSLRGPGKFDATFVFDDEPISAEASFGQAGEDRSVSVKLAVSAASSPVTLTTDGTFAWPADAPPAYEGLATIAGVQPEEGEARSPWADLEAHGAFELALDSLGVEAAQLSYGGTERPLILAGRGRLDFADRPHFDATVTARQIDLDRALGGKPDDPVAVDAVFRDMLDALPMLPFTSVPGNLHLNVQGVAIGGNIVQGVAADLATAENGWRIERFGAVLPGDTEIAFDGTLTTSGEPAFRGRGRIASQRPAALAAWWRGKAGSAGDIERFTIAADLDLGPEAQRIANIAAGTGESSFGGLIEFRRFGESGGRFVSVDLDADRVDVTEVQALKDLFGSPSFAAGDIDQVTLSLRAEALAAGEVEAHSVVLEGILQDGSVDLRRLTVADLAGASIDARGSVEHVFGTPLARLDAAVEAQDIGGALDFAKSLLPENVTVARLQEMAPLLSPVKADISAEGGFGDQPISLDLTGSFAKTHVKLTAKGQGSLDSPNSLSGKVTLHIDGQDSAAVLTQLGFAPIPVEAGPLRLDASLEGMLASAASLELDGTVAGVDVAYTAETVIAGGQIALLGNVQAESADIDSALLMAGLPVPGLGEGHAASAAGRLEIGGNSARLQLNDASFAGHRVGGEVQALLGGRLGVTGTLNMESASLPVLASIAVGGASEPSAAGWSDSAFAAALPPDLTLDVRLMAKTLDLGFPRKAAEAEVALEYSGGKLDIQLADAELAGGRLKGAIAATLADGEADASLRGSLMGGKLDPLVWRRSDLPVASGLVDVSFNVSGRGRSMAGLVSTLSGNGSFAISGGRLNTVNPAALSDVMNIAEGDEEPDEEQAREAFAISFGVGALPFGNLAGAFSVTGGVLEAPTVSLRAGPATLLADARLDFNTRQLKSDWSIRLAEPDIAEEAQPSVRISFEGPIVRPERRVDLNPLLAALRAHFLQRQLDKLEMLEAERQRHEAALRLLEPEIANGAEPTNGSVAPVPGSTTTGASSDAPAEDAPATTGTAPRTPVTPSPASAIQRLAPAVRDMIGGGAGVFGSSP